MAKMSHVTQAMYHLNDKDEPIRITSGPTEGVMVYQNGSDYYTARIVDDGVIVDVTEFNTLPEAMEEYDALVAVVV